MRRLILSLFSILILTSCQSTPNLSSPAHVEKLVKQIKRNPENIGAIAKQAEQSRQAIKYDVARIKQALAELEQFVEKQWGKGNSELPSTRKYVKYSNDYQARAIIDFTKGSITVETIATKQPLQMLKQAIVTTLLTPADPANTDIFSSDAPTLGETPFLYRQVIDTDRKPIRYQWRAGRFADYLVSQKLVKGRLGKKPLHQVNFTLVTDHQKLRKHQYSEHVIAASRKYQIAPSLIYAIIETESSFNPFAVSHANAYGLMQVVPATAGRDVYQKIKRKPGQPSKQVLFDPAQNIDIGTAYLSILDDRYLQKVANRQSKHYAMISAYNGGTGNVLKTFHSNRNTAFTRINQLESKSVYWALTNKHPRAESRNYLKKVTSRESKYQ
ncbi:DUF3393 domain-containing protein [Thalassotalea euphylliae]|uniref:DUF3393 domain-containing protein n=1 Tax=Thalassotalea euphylliae TaxID=1655234 RepID=A0A3E0TWJ9_9GAMM|nr:murein transglycosylase domain-containing protein [Thalassotalea euphylliae]REL28723.1 DUF3393 domain-containing protein [Thalassotalea euphylliae]